MRFVFATLQHVESDFYGRVGSELAAQGHEVFHLTYSRRSAANLRRRGIDAHCLPDLMSETRPGELDSEERRILERYRIPSLREVYRTDVLPNADVDACRERTVRHFLAIEGLFERLAPNVLVSEAGNESIRTVSQLVAGDLGVLTMYPLYTIFDYGLRLYTETMDAPIVPEEDLRPLSPDEEAELDDFKRRYAERDRPIREYRKVRVKTDRLSLILRHVVVRAVWDRDNPYLRPGSWLIRDAREAARARVARSLYSPEGERPFLYFPLHVTGDYKIRRLRPHCADQEAILGEVAAALPPEVELVVKEHPMSIGRNPIAMLRRLSRIPNVRLVDPHTSSLRLLSRAEGVVTISSTVGLEALLFERPVLTLGRPFYSGYGVTLDLDSPSGVDAAVPRLLDFEPDRERTRRFLHAAMRRCQPGAPVLVDRSDANARVLAASFARTAAESGAGVRA